MSAPSHGDDEPSRFAAADEAAFRALLDRGGILREGALEAPARAAAYAVFSQRADAALDVAALRHNASRFFAVKIGLTVEKAYGAEAPSVDAARVIVSADDAATSGTRLVYGRPADPNDLAAAAEAERAAGSNGLALLAQRCPTLWLVVRETADDDLVALTIAAIFASVTLGPILPPDGREIFGVRTARLKLERRTSPYR